MKPGRRAELLGSSLSIALLLGLALASWIVVRVTLQSIPDRSARGPDAVVGEVYDARIQASDALGQPRYQIQSPRMQQLSDGRLLLTDPLVYGQKPGEPDMRLRAAEGLVSSDHALVTLKGNVQLVRPESAQRPELQIDSSEMLINLDQGTAQTSQPIQIRRGTDRLVGVGMRYRQKTDQLEILSEAQLLLPPSPTRNRSAPPGSAIRP